MDATDPPENDRPPRTEAGGIYIHIPFCHVKCRFCDFAAFPGRLADIPRYLSALSREMERRRGKVLETLYVGGGTPSVLDETQWDFLMGSVHRTFVFAKGHEMTVEGNPESLTREKLETMAESGVNRLSFGLQASQDFLLKGIGRLHDFDGFVSVFRAARSAGFSNLNVDLMYGLPGQDLSHWRETLGRVVAMSPEHISAYALTVEERTAFGHAGAVPDDDLQADMYEAASGFLEEAGYVHYEISNFARPGFECRHNLRYWKNLPCLGAGVSAAGYENGVRRKNTSYLDRYMTFVEEGRSPVAEEEALSEAGKVGEDLMLGLRLKEGVRLSPRARNLYGSVLEKYESCGFLEIDRRASTVRPTLKGWRLSNRLFQELLSPPDGEKTLPVAINFAS